MPWILLADQVIFALADVVTGFWLDRVRRGIALFGGWLIGATVLSGVAFLAMAFTGGHPALLLGSILVWAVTSSALRSPPWALLSRHAAKPELPWLAAVVLTGSALAGAAAPYLGMTLRDFDPRIPFAVSTLALLAAVAVLVIAERRSPVAPGGEQSEYAPPRIVFGVFAAVLLFAIGFQVHFSLNSVPQYLRVADKAELPWLMPVFWIGFNLLMFPASALVKRIGAAPMLAMAGVLGTLSVVFCALAASKNTLIAWHFIAGGCWGAASVAAYTAAVGFGRTGREGRFLGTLFAVLAAVAFARIGAVATGLAADPSFRSALPWVPALAWALAAAIVLAIRPASPASR